MVGFPLFAGIGRRSDEGALELNSGAGDVESDGGVRHELSSCVNVILINLEFDAREDYCF